jgi:ABC-type Fe3+/spermidine/putrescine transport system ATPase subunit
MNAGTIQQIGPTADIYERPANRFVAEFMGQSNLLPASVIERRQDVVLCRLAGGDVVPAATDAELSAGQSVLLALRSERLRLVGSGPRDPAVAAPLLTGLIDHVTYLGGLIQIRVRLASGAIVKVAVQNASGYTALAVGSPAHLTFEPGDVVVLPDEAGTAMPAPSTRGAVA